MFIIPCILKSYKVAWAGKTSWKRFIDRNLLFISVDIAKCQWVVKLHVTQHVVCLITALRFRQRSPLGDRCRNRRAVIHFANYLYLRRHIDTAIRYNKRKLVIGPPQYQPTAAGKMNNRWCILPHNRLFANRAGHGCAFPTSQDEPVSSGLPALLR